MLGRITAQSRGLSILSHLTLPWGRGSSLVNELIVFESPGLAQHLADLRKLENWSVTV